MKVNLKEIMLTIKIKTIFRFLPLFLYHAVFAVIVFTNFPWGKFFIGWDALNPEFNLSLNFQRSFFASWQENYGLGTLGGHGFAAQLPHTMIISILSSLFPLWAVRSVFTFLCLYLGGLGLYFLAKLIFYKITVEEYQKKFSTAIKYICLLTALFYILNLATVQIFYLPLEAFIVHFASLPWLFWIIFRLAGETNRKNLILFFIINFFASIQGFIPSLFVAYVVSLSLFAFVYILVNRFHWVAVKKSLLVLFLTFLVNAYWLLPFGYYQISKGVSTQEAYDNLMSTEDFILKNKKYGSLQNIALMKGFSFDMQELGGYVFQPWIEQYNQNGIRIIGYGLFVFVLVSAVLSLILIHHVLVKISAVIFLYFLTSLATDSPVFSQFTQIMQLISPSYYQAFRTAFTKFALGYSFLFSLFLGLGLYILLGYSYRLLKYKLISLSVFLGLFSLLIYFTYPVFKGNLLYKKLQVNIPQAYFEVMDFFKNKEDGRIADFPQDCPEGWYGYGWGYFGSGFSWYALQQPVLARSFDVWSNYNENYYWEIVQAVRSHDYARVDKVMQKYGVRWLLYDPNLIPCRSNRGLLQYDDFINHLESSPKYRLVKPFTSTGILPIKIFEITNLDPKDFVFLAEGLPVVNSYKWNNYDKAYEEYGNYVTNINPSTNSGQKSKIKDEKSENKSSAGGFGGFFGTRHCKECDNDTKEENNYDGYSKNNSGAISHVSFLLPRNLDNNTLTNQLPIVPSIPHRNISQFSLSTPAIMGDKTTTPKITWPALSNIFANRNNSSAENTGFFGNGGLIKTIYAQDNTENGQPATGSNSVIYYPFRSLFTGRKQEELEFEVTDQGDYFSFTAKIPADLVGTKLVMPNLVKEEVTEYDSNDLKITTEKLPEIYLDGELKSNLEVRVPKIKGYYSADIESGIRNQELRSCDQFNQGLYTHERVRPLGSSRSDPDLLRLTSVGSSNCLDFDVPQLSQRLGYVVTVENRNIEGKSLLFGITNKNSQRSDLETYFPKKQSTINNQQLTIERSYFVIPPMEPYALGYTLHFDNISIGRVKTVNDLGRITVNPIPYRFLTELKIIKGDPLRLQGVPLKNLQYTVEHPNPSFYQIELSNRAIEQSSNLTLVLSQSFDDGWKAFQIQNSKFKIQNYLNVLFPFLFGKELKDHILVNNWENGWVLNDKTMQQFNSSTIIIVYLPQYLEYIGFGLLLFIPFLFISPRHSHLL